MKVIESPTTGVTASQWKTLLQPKAISDPIPPGFENIKQISAKAGKSVAATRAGLHRAFKCGEVDMIKLRFGTTAINMRQTVFFRPKNYEKTNQKQNTKHSRNR